MTTQFTVGKTYSITGYNDTIKVVKRTEKSVWFEYAGETLRKKIHETSCGEKLVLDGGSACIFAVSVIEPQASINEPETIETPNNVVNFSDYHSKVKASNDEIITLDEVDLIHIIQDLTLIELENTNRKKLETLESEEFPQDDNLNTLESDTTEILETLEFPQDEILETLEFPQDEILETLDQGSTQDLDKFEVVYQVLCNLDEISYESRTVYATSKDHAKAIVSLDLQSQHLRFCITGVEDALVIEDLSDFAMVGHGEF